MLAGTPLGEAAMASAANGHDTDPPPRVFEGAAPRRRGRPRKPFAEQPIIGPDERRGPGGRRLKTSAAERVRSALADARAHLGADPIGDPF